MATDAQTEVLRFIDALMQGAASVPPMITTPSGAIRWAVFAAEVIYKQEIAALPAGN